MKKRFLYSFIGLVIGITSSLSAVCQWHTIARYAPDPVNYLQNTSFIDGKEGYIAFAGSIAYTSDSGRTLITRTINVPEFPFHQFYFQGVKALDANTVLAYGEENITPVILRSQDKGLTWKTVYQRPIVNPDNVGDGVNQLAVIDASHLVALHKGFVGSSDDGGNSWSFTPEFGTPHNFTDLSVHDAQRVYVIGDGQLFRLGNFNGLIAINGGIFNQVTKVAVAPTGRVYVTDANGQLYSSTDNAASWKDLTAPGLYNSYINSWFFTNDSAGFAIIDGQIRHTSNHGVTWEKMSADADMSVDANMASSYSAVNDQLIFAAGTGRLLYATVNGGGTPVPKAWFSVDTSHMSSDSMIYLTNYSALGYSYKWLRNDTLLATTYHASYKTNRVQKDSIKLIVTNAAGADTVLDFAETRIPNPICNVDFNIFKDTSTVVLGVKGFDIDYRVHTWEMGDGAVLTGHHPTYQYKKRDLYKIVHRVQDPVSGCSAWAESAVNITQLTRCDYTLDTFFHITDSVVNDSVWFFYGSNSGVGSPLDLTYRWRFGDGDSAAGDAWPLPAHVYENSGTYYPLLNIIYNNGICNQYRVDTVVISKPDCSAKFRATGKIVVGLTAQPLNNPSRKRHTWIFDDKDSTSSLRSVYSGHDFDYYTTRWDYACRQSRYGWYRIINMDSTIRKIKHIVTDSVTGCVAMDSLYIDQGFSMHGTVDLGAVPQLIIYQDYNNPYLFNIQENMGLPSGSEQCLTIEGGQSMSNKQGFFKVNLAKDGVYFADALEDDQWAYIWRKKIIVDGEQRYFWNNPNNEVVGRIFIDINGNGIRDAGEPFYTKPAKIFGATGQQHTTLYNEQGRFRFTMPSGDVKTSLVLDKPYYTVSPAEKTSVFGTRVGQSDTVLFALKPIAGLQDGTIRLTASPARPGFAASYSLQVSNPGNTTFTPHVILKRNNKLSVLSTTPAAQTDTPDSLVWDLAPLQPGASTNILLTVSIPAPPSVNIRDTLDWSARLAFPGTDADSSDNSYLLRQVVTGSFDPNEKYENFGGLIRKSQIDSGQWIYYTVRLQNTGTDTAFNITLRDTLDSRLDASSFQMLDASHPYKLTVSDNGQLTWLFKQILLPDSNRNEEKSHAFVQYRIKALTALRSGDSVVNGASIYFDFNTPVGTNRQVTIVDHRDLPRPAIVIAGVLCKSDHDAAFVITNPTATVSVLLDGHALSMGDAGVVPFDPSQLDAGKHRLQVIFADNTTHAETDTAFEVRPVVPLVVHMTSSTQLVSHYTDSVILTATAVSDGGGVPSSWFNLSRTFDNTAINAPGPVLRMTGSSIPVGTHRIYVRMTTTGVCPDVAAAYDSVEITRLNDTVVTATPSVPGAPDISIYPNPFHGDINFTKLDPNHRITIMLSSMTGKTLISQPVAGRRDYTLPCHQLAKGMYLLTIYDEKQRCMLGPVTMVKW